MNRWISKCAFAAFLSFATHAFADPTVVQPGYIAEVTAGNYGGMAFDVACYYQTGTCAGGGPFVQITAPTATLTATYSNHSTSLTPTTNPITAGWRPGYTVSGAGIPGNTFVVSLTSTTIAISNQTTHAETSVTITTTCNNGANYISDGSSHCFQRTNFGSGGVVDARQCGIVGDFSNTSDAANLNTCMTLASIFSGSSPNVQAITTVFTGGGVILDNTVDLTPPAGIELNCGADNRGLLPNDDYRIVSGMSNAIVLDPQYKINLSNANTSFTHCNLEAGAGLSNNNPYSPSIYYPELAGSTPFLRQAMNEASAFNPNPSSAYSGGGPAGNSIGIYAAGDHVAVRNVTVLGFGTCYESDTGGKRLEMDYLMGDCNTGVSINHSPDFTRFNAFDISPLLTRNLSGVSIANWNISAIQDNGSGVYQVIVEADPSVFPFAIGDTIWVGTSRATTGAESAAGRWTISAASSTGTGTCSITPCQWLTLSGSVSSGTSMQGNVSMTMSNGVPATAITGLTGNLNSVAVGQIVSDTGFGGCIASGTLVTDVWPSQGIVYISLPPTCSSTGDTLSFGDHAYSATPVTCATGQPNNCVTLDPDFRFGDGEFVLDTGGMSVVNCSVYEHSISFHLYTSGNSSRFANCATGENQGLPDNGIIGVKIDGDHTGKDACDTTVVNGILGQHRPVGILIDSDCNRQSRIANVSVAPFNGGQSGIAFEVDAGGVAIANATGTTNGDAFISGTSYMVYQSTPGSYAYGSGYTVGDTLTLSGCTTNPHLTVTALTANGGVAAYSIATVGNCSAPPNPITWSGGTGSGFKTYADVANASTVLNQVTISNNQLPQTNLYLKDATAAAQTAGCGNVFDLPTAYQCPPASLVPGGRLTLTAGTPVMNGMGVSAATVVYYVPYVSQQVPIYYQSLGSGSFSLADIGSAGVSTNLSNTIQLNGSVYDIFAETLRIGTPELCIGPAWSTSTTRGTGYNSTAINQLSGIWVNTNPMNCTHGINVVPCPPSACTYLGTMYATGNGHTEALFQPTPSSGGTNNVIGIWNAYNRVRAFSASTDTHAMWACTTCGSWEPLDAGVGTGGLSNRISVIDGLGQSGYDALLIEANTNAGSSLPQIAACVDATTCTPVNPAQAANTAQNSVPFELSGSPAQGFHYIQAVQHAANATAAFGTNATLRLDWEY
jgi:hypothetical protein